MPSVRHVARRTTGPARSARHSRRRLFHGTRDRETGASLLEGAIVAPVFFLLVFGLMDGSWMLFGDHVTRGSASAGVRTASALARDPEADYQTLMSVKGNIDSLPAGSLIRVVVYKANGYGDPPTAGCQNGVAQSGVCNVYDGNDLKRAASAFGCKSPTALDGFWCPTARKAALRGAGSPPDYVGVWIRANHSTLTRLVFPASRTITAHAVLRVEPRAS